MAERPHHVKIVIFKDDGSIEWEENVTLVIDYDPTRVGVEDDSLKGIDIQAVIGSEEGEPDPRPEGWKRERWSMKIIDTEPTRWTEVTGPSQ